MNTNEKICIWMGYHKHKHAKELFINMELKPQYFKPDFIHDRNQQKWIRDELKKRGYKIIETESLTFNSILIFKGDESYSVAAKSNEKDLDIAFIEAIMQLIENENQDEKK